MTTSEQNAPQRRPRSLEVRKAAAEVAILIAEKRGEKPDPDLLKLVGRAS